MLEHTPVGLGGNIIGRNWSNIQCLAYQKQVNLQANSAIHKGWDDIGVYKAFWLTDLH
jgi:hypothetical protein